jgi:hypothetical protein
MNRRTKRLRNEHVVRRGKMPEEKARGWLGRENGGYRLNTWLDGETGGRGETHGWEGKNSG